MGCCGFGGGGGSSPIVLTPDRVVVTDSLGVLTVGPYWNSTGPMWGLASAPARHVDVVISSAIGLTARFLNSNVSAGYAILDVQAGITTVSAASSVARILVEGYKAFLLLYARNTGTNQNAYVNYRANSSGFPVFGPIEYEMGLFYNGTEYDFRLCRGSLGAYNYLIGSYLGSETQISFLGAASNVLYQFYVASSASALSADRIYRFEVAGGADGVIQMVNTGTGDLRLSLDTGVAGSPFVRWYDGAYYFSLGKMSSGDFVLTNGVDLASGSNIFKYSPSSGYHTLYSENQFQIYCSVNGGIGQVLVTNGFGAAGSGLKMTLQGNGPISLAFESDVMVLSHDLAGECNLQITGNFTTVITGDYVFRQTGSGIFFTMASAFVTTGPASPVNNGEWTFYVLENGGVNTFEVRYKDGGGTVRAGSIALV